MTKAKVKCEDDLVAKRASEEGLGPVQADCIYPMKLFKQLTGLQDYSIRQVRRRGMRVLKCGKHNFVLGSDFIEFLVRENEPQAPGRNN